MIWHIGSSQKYTNKGHNSEIFMHLSGEASLGKFSLNLNGVLSHKCKQLCQILPQLIQGFLLRNYVVLLRKVCFIHKT